MITILACIFFMGCASNDMNTILILNNRMTAIETRLIQIEDKILPKPVVVTNNVAVDLIQDYRSMIEMLKQKPALATEASSMLIAPTTAYGIHSYMNEKGKEKTITNIVTKTNIVYKTENVYEHIINIQNSNGSTLALKFILKNGRWVGPKGEMYDSIPKKRDVERMYKQ